MSTTRRRVSKNKKMRLSRKVNLATESVSASLERRSKFTSYPTKGLHGYTHVLIRRSREDQKFFFLILYFDQQLKITGQNYF